MAKRILIVTDEQLDLLLDWQNAFENEAGQHSDEDEALIRKIKEARLA